MFVHIITLETKPDDALRESVTQPAALLLLFVIALTLETNSNDVIAELVIFR